MREQYTGMNPAIVDSLVYVGVGIIAAGVIHIIVVRLKQRAAMTETKMGCLLVHSLGTPLVMLAFFFPFFGGPARSLHLSPVPGDNGFENFSIRLYPWGTWIIAAFVDGFLRTYGIALADLNIFIHPNMFTPACHN